MSTPSQALADELNAVNSIYDAGTLIIGPDGNLKSSTRTILKLPDLPFSFSVSFPSDYPDSPPEFIGTQSTGRTTKKGEGDAAVAVLRDVLGRIFVPGQVCLFDLIEETSLLLEAYRISAKEKAITASINNGTTESPNSKTTVRSASPTINPPSESLPNSGLTESIWAVPSSIPPPAWSLSEPATFNKSTFVGRALRISSLREATDAISHLLATDKKVANAHHNITAWRIKQVQHTNHASAAKAGATGMTNEIIIQDCDDDGETAAGGRLLHLMQLMDVWNVVVVVTRWYGGVKLGPDRFRLINAAGREALMNAGLAAPEFDNKNGKGKGKKK